MCPKPKEKTIGTAGCLKRAPTLMINGDMSRDHPDGKQKRKQNLFSPIFISFFISFFFIVPVISTIHSHSIQFFLPLFFKFFKSSYLKIKNSLLDFVTSRSLFLVFWTIQKMKMPKKLNV